MHGMPRMMGETHCASLECGFSRVAMVNFTKHGFPDQSCLSSCQPTSDAARRSCGFAFCIIRGLDGWQRFFVFEIISLRSILAS